jgi:hypothetical protein
MSTQRVSGLLHKHGGTITAIHAIAHETFKGVADWFFVGDVVWRDGTASKAAHISPISVCCETDADKPQVDALMKALNDYLEEAGEWHDQKSKRDGRVYMWTPREPKGSKAVQS